MRHLPAVLFCQASWARWTSPKRSLGRKSRGAEPLWRRRGPPRGSYVPTPVPPAGSQREPPRRPPLPFAASFLWPTQLFQCFLSLHHRPSPLRFLLLVLHDRSHTLGAFFQKIKSRFFTGARRCVDQVCNARRVSGRELDADDEKKREVNAGLPEELYLNSRVCDAKYCPVSFTSTHPSKSARGISSQ